MIITLTKEARKALPLDRRAKINYKVVFGFGSLVCDVGTSLSHMPYFDPDSRSESV